MSARRPWAWPLVPIYWAGLRVKDVLFRAGLPRPRRLTWPVVSVGSLSAGGAGKTPIVIALAQLLQRHGWYVDVLSRGYGREGQGIELVDLAATSPATRFGDEPVLIAQRTPVPVWVGAQRWVAGAAAEAAVPANAPPQRRVHLLDDGFQHRKLARTLDVVILTAEDLRDHLLPAGNLRERLHALRRADAIILRDEEWNALNPHLPSLLRPGTPIWSIRRELHTDDLPRQVPVLAFCGIARPEGFTELLARTGTGVLQTVAFSDHHAYTVEDAQGLAELGAACEARGFVTTEKDAVKLSPQIHERLAQVGPVWVTRLEVTFVNEGEIIETFEERCR